MNSPEEVNPFAFKEKPWSHHSTVIWLGSTITLSRNVEKFNFPGKLPIDKRNQILSLLTKGFLASGPLEHFRLIRPEEMSPFEKEYLMEHFLSHQSVYHAYTGEAFVVDQTGQFLAVLNLKDHLLLHWVDTQEELESAWNRLVNIEAEINKSVNFAFSPTFGFLTSDPHLCGSACVVTIFLHLPALIHTNHLDEVVNKYKGEGIEQTGLQGDPHELIGDIVAFHNRYTLGVTEENILSSLQTLAIKLVLEEQGMRQHLKRGTEHEVAEMKNRVSRAYALLLHSYQIETIEAMHALSLVKLGFDLEWVKGGTQSIFNALLFNCRRGHLLCRDGGKINPEELPHRRAEYIHQALHCLQLLI